MVTDQFSVGMEVGGGFDFEFSADTYNSLIDGAMMAAPALGVWKIGTEDISYTLEKEFTDLTANHFLQYSGERVGEFDIGFAFGEPVAGSFGMAGATVKSASISLVGAGSVAAPTTTRIMNAVSDLSGIIIDGVAFSGCLSEVQLNINNNLRPAECIGSATPSDQILGTAEVTGSISAHLTDTTIQWYTEQVINQTKFEIEFTITDGTTTYKFHIPNARISGDSPMAEGINTDVMVEIEFLALYDETEGSSLVITKS